MPERRKPTIRSDPREGVWSGRPLPVRRTAKALPSWWQPFVFGPVVYLLVTPAIDSGFPAWLASVFLVGLIAWAALALVWQVAETLALRELNRDRAFSDAPPGVVEFPMEIVLYDAGAYVGADRGFAWFDEGRLIFNGAASSFALAAGDFHLRGRGLGPRRDHFSKVPNDALHLRTGRGTAYVQLRPLVGRKGLGFRFTLKRFLKQSVGTGAPRQWPPLMPYEVARAIKQVEPGPKDPATASLQ